MKSEILEFIKHNSNWKKKLSEEPYNLRIAQEDSFFIFNYGITPDFSLSLVQEARGIIIDVRKMQVVCFPFSKFFNYNEPYAHTIDWFSAKCQEKIDGSLIKFWFNFYTKKWQTSTNKNIDARKAMVNERISFFDLVQYAKNDVFDYFLANADKTATHMFELTSPYNRIIIHYDEPKLWYLGSRINSSGQEYFFSQGLVSPKTYPLKNLESCLKHLTEKEIEDIEGFIVVDKHFNRIKIKTERYVKMARLKNNGSLTTKRILNIIAEGEKEEFLAYFPMYKEWFEEVELKLKILKIEIIASCRAAEIYYHKIGKNRKELAKEFANNPYKSFIFAHIDGKKINEEQIRKMIMRSDS